MPTVKILTPAAAARRAAAMPSACSVSLVGSPVAQEQRSTVSGASKNALPANATSPNRSPPSCPDEVLHGQPRTREPVGGNVRGEHALGDVHDDDQVPARGGAFRGFSKPSRGSAIATRNAASPASSSAYRQRRRPALDAPVSCARKRGTWDQTLQPLLRAALGPQKQRSEHGQRQQPQSHGGEPKLSAEKAAVIPRN